MAVCNAIADFKSSGGERCSISALSADFVSPPDTGSGALALSSDCCDVFNNASVSRSFTCSATNKRMSRLAVAKSRLSWVK
ncbi:hypothetical protein D3C84_806980 [compost metagenome]